MTLETFVDPAGTASEWARTLGFLNAKFNTGIRSPLDTTILERPCPAADGYTIIDEIPFDFDRRRVSVIVGKTGANPPERLLIAKGAPEGMLPLCDQHQCGDTTAALDEAGHNSARKTMRI